MSAYDNGVAAAFALYKLAAPAWLKQFRQGNIHTPDLLQIGQHAPLEDFASMIGMENFRHKAPPLPIAPHQATTPLGHAQLQSAIDGPEQRLMGELHRGARQASTAGLPDWETRGVLLGGRYDSRVPTASRKPQQSMSRADFRAANREQSLRALGGPGSVAHARKSP